MKKLLLVVSWISFHTICSGQKSIDGLVQAEEKFAAYSVANSTKEAFLKFADSSGIVFDNGKPVNAIEIWNKRENRPGKLNWWPEYAVIAASMDFGYTTGPWAFSINDTVKVNGYYITVWHINNKGEWKFLVDLGVNGSCDFAVLDKTISKIDVRNEDAESSLKQVEQDLIANYSKNGKASYNNVLSSSSILYRNRMCKAVSEQQHKIVLDSLPLKIQYTINGEGVASTGDIGYTYGTTIIRSKTDNYLRIWRREKDGWKIAVEVLRY
jgi:ketosteroid isomerase-like protein